MNKEMRFYKIYSLIMNLFMTNQR